jgi:hypothetical protein
MYFLKAVGLTCLSFFKQVWLLPQTVSLALQQRRQQSSRNATEAERLDRIRNPSKYLGK